MHIESVKTYKIGTYLVRSKGSGHQQITMA